MKTLGEIFLKPLGESLSAEEDSHQSLPGGQVTRATGAAQAGQQLCFYVNIQLHFPQGKVALYYVILISS